MATYQVRTLISLNAEADMSNDYYKFVALGTAPETMKVANSTDEVIGVHQYTKPVAGQPGAVAIDGRVLVRCGGTIAKGAGVGSNANGFAVTGGTEGTALEAGVNGQVIPVLLKMRTA